METKHPGRWLARLSGNENGWGGFDHIANGGVARWTNDGGTRTVHAFTPNMVGLWSVVVDDNAPESVFAATWAAAVKAVR